MARGCNTSGYKKREGRRGCFFGPEESTLSLFFLWRDERVFAALFHVFDDCVTDHSCLADAMFSSNSFKMGPHGDRRSEAQGQKLWRSVFEFMAGELFGVHGSHCGVGQSDISD